MKGIWALALLVSIGLCIAAWSGMAVAEEEESGQELQNYFSNANVGVAGNALVNIIAPFEGNPTAANPALGNGETCAMIYVFDTEPGDAGLLRMPGDGGWPVDPQHHNPIGGQPGGRCGGRNKLTHRRLDPYSGKLAKYPPGGSVRS